MWEAFVSESTSSGGGGTCPGGGGALSGWGLRGLNKLLKKLLETVTTATYEAATLKAYRISVVFLFCNIRKQTEYYKKGIYHSVDGNTNRKKTKPKKNSLTFENQNYTRNTDTNPFIFGYGIQLQTVITFCPLSSVFKCLC